MELAYFTTLPNVGADELTDAPVLRRSLPAGDVGPGWLIRPTPAPEARIGSVDRGDAIELARE